LIRNFNKVVNLRTAAAAVLSLLLVGRVAQDQRARNAVSGPHGRYTLAQIIKRSMPLCGALDTSHDSLRLICEPLPTSADGKTCLVWMVDGLDPQGKFKVHLVWDAETGELMVASRSVEPRRWKKGVELKRKEAQQITSSWLTTLGISELASGWKPDSDLHDTNFVWRVKWRTGTRGVSVSIDARTGEFIMAQTMRRVPKVDPFRIAQGRETKGSSRAGS